MKAVKILILTSVVILSIIGAVVGYYAIFEGSPYFWLACLGYSMLVLALLLAIGALLWDTVRNVGTMPS